MTRYFNTEGSCNPREHYMVRLDGRLGQIKRMLVDRKKYFVINRGRQYGKTTTLRALRDYLKADYIVLSLDFQKLGTEDFADAPTFVRAFAEILIEAFEKGGVDGGTAWLEPLARLAETDNSSLKRLFVCLSRLCGDSPRPIVLMIDEVDSASNNQVFIDFLAQLRGYYLDREETPIFHSVILAGVYSIKNLKLKIRSESEQQYNSSWNIAADFDIDMSFPADQIADMLGEYEADYHTGMDTHEVAEEIFQYTSGYPVLVSTICKWIDEKAVGSGGFENLGGAWTKDGVAQAVKSILKGGTLLFESMAKQLDTYRELRDMIESILYQGKRIPFSPNEKSVSIGRMFGFLKEKDGCVEVSNRIFEMCLLNLFMAEEALGSDIYTRGESDRLAFIRDGRLDMDLVLRKFAEYFDEIYGREQERFVETNGRKLFLLYLKPIINGAGNYYMEAQTRDARRTDVIVDYGGEQFVIELKIWRGNEYNERGEPQLADYLDYYHKDRGYMLSFNFNKNKKTGANEVRVGNRTIVEVVV